MQVSLRFHNDTYAPGIATYGIQGKPGDQGDPGRSMFFTSYSLGSTDEFKLFAEKITSRKLPIKAEDITLERDYVNGDSFVDNAGKVYLLIDINKMSTDSANGSITNNTAYIKQIGKFSDSSVPFDEYRASTIRETLLTIKDVEATASSTTALLNIARNNTGNGEVDFINMSALYGATADINLDIKYDNGCKGFVIDSKYPIVISGNLYVNQKDDVTTTLTSDYSPVLTTNNGITDFIGTCKEIQYKLDASIFTYTKADDTSTIYYGSIYTVTLEDTLHDPANDTVKITFDEDYNIGRYYADSSLMLHFLNKEFQDFQLYRQGEYTYYFKQNYDYVKHNDMLNKVATLEIYDIQLSMINNFEVFLKCKERNVTGFELSNVGNNKTN